MIQRIQSLYLLLVVVCYILLFFFPVATYSTMEASFRFSILQITNSNPAGTIDSGSTGPGTRALIAPRFLDIHRINDTHQHIGMIYWARPKVGSARCARTPQRGVPTRLTLATNEHHDIRWCSAAELDKLQPPMSDAVKWYCRAAIREISSQT